MSPWEVPLLWWGCMYGWLRPIHLVQPFRRGRRRSEVSLHFHTLASFHTRYISFAEHGGPWTDASKLRGPARLLHVLPLCCARLGPRHSVSARALGHMAVRTCSRRCGGQLLLPARSPHCISFAPAPPVPVLCGLCPSRCLVGHPTRVGILTKFYSHLLALRGASL